MKSDIDLGGGFVAEQTVNALAEEYESRDERLSQTSHGVEYYYYRAQQ